MRKKLLSIFTAVVLTVSMAACGKDQGLIMLIKTRVNLWEKK